MFSFANYDGPGRGAYFIGSADLMPRNLDRRFEVMVPVRDPALCDEIRGLLRLQLADTLLAWSLGSEGRWTRLSASQAAEGVNAQVESRHQAVERSRRASL